MSEAFKLTRREERPATIEERKSLVNALWNLCAFAERHGFENEPVVQAARRALSQSIG